jgi:hypothetical protein
MEELVIKIKFDDNGGYKGHGENVEELILNSIKTAIEMDLEHDDVIKSNWSVEILK